MSWINTVVMMSNLVVGAEQTYTLIEANSYLYVEVKPAGLLSAASHHHVVRATKWTGEVRWDPEAPEKCSIKIDIPVSGLVVDEPVMRKRLRFKKSISDGDRRRVKDNMLAEDQLNGKKFGEIHFRSTGCKKLGPAVRVSGQLEIRGVKKAITVDMKVSFKKNQLRALGEFELTHKDFGFSPYSAGLGAISNAEGLTFHVRAIGQR